ncbi:MAG: glycosyltransferase [Clostridia bacterium]|nr:glycosyltransferase [Clostridia bacterium]
MKKRVLLITRHFAPENIISAIRPTKVAKYLTRAGFEVTVLTQKPSVPEDGLLCRDLAECGRVLRADSAESSSFFSRLLHRPLHRPKKKEKSGLVGAGATSEEKSIGTLHRIISGYRQFLRVKRREMEFYRSTMNYVQHAGLDLSHFDVMISSYSPMATHMVALALKEKCPTLRWIADYRDPMDPCRPAPLRRYYDRWQKRVLNHCDAVTAASEGYLKMLLKGHPDLCGVPIYNGYDPEDGEEETAVPLPEEKKVFRILGMGGLYAGRRDVSIVFSAVSDLLKSGRIRRDQICIDYYGAGTSAPYLKRKIDELELPPFFYDHGRVPREEVLLKQKQAQMVLSSGWDTSDYHGVIPGKFSEQLLLRKPILGVVCGSGKKSELHRLIHSLRVGYCYEEGNHADSYEGLKKYIAESFTYWRTRNKELYEPDEKKRAAFDYNNLIREWIEVINDDNKGKL